MHTILRYLRHTLFLNLKELLLFQLLFNACLLILTLTLGNFLFQTALRFSRYSYLTSENIPGFLLSPLTLLFLALFFLIFAVLSYFDFCILLTGFQAAAGKKKIGCAQMVHAGILQGFETFSPASVRCSFPLLALSLFSNIYFLYHLCYRINPLCTFIPIFLRPFYIKIILAVFFLLTGLYLFFRLYVFPYRFLGKQDPKNARKKSRRLFLSYPLPVIIGIFLGMLLAALFWHLLCLVLSGLSSICVSVFAPSDLKTALRLTLNYYVIMLSLWIVFVISSVFFPGIVTFFYYLYSEFYPDQNGIVYHHTIPRRLQKYLYPLITAFLAAGILLYFYFGIYTGVLCVERATPFTQIIVHRGVSSEAPENTLPAIELADDYLADLAEIDVQCSLDGEVFVFHDASLSRITGCNALFSVADSSLIRSLDAGSFFSKDYENTPIPTLAEVLEAAKGQIGLLIELKRNDSGDDLVNKVMDLIEEYGMEHQCLLQSSDYTYLCQIKERNSEMETGYILSTALGNYFNNDNIDFFSVRSAFITATAVRRAHEAGKRIFSWTVNSREELERMKRIGVDAVITDYPIRAREIFYRDADWESILTPEIELLDELLEESSEEIPDENEENPENASEENVQKASKENEEESFVPQN